MEILKHRVNRISDIDSRYGAEIDVRDHKGIIVLSHDYPKDDSIHLDEFLKHFPKNRLLAINIKSSGIESDIYNILKKHDHNNYFLFDFSVPYLLKSINLKIPCAFRVSEYEKELFQNCGWVWIDSFHESWYDKKYLQNLASLGLKNVLVSPELHNRNNMDENSKIKTLIMSGLIYAICTDNPNLWHD